MSVGAQTAKELAMLGVNLEIKEGLGADTIKDLVMICKSKGTKIAIHTPCLGANSAKQITIMAQDTVTFIID
ncbi:hypothetical protein [Ectopseudomonas hydrolytica]|uniref:hypothetical protein n=1 Tax=Ectopseudomonas hydrolytica TaxID=2493633 RepID=UPI0020B796A7|nr:hypothetical protein [Pseudomonas hydrolytica]UTH30087.1 hypothetical protein NLY38_16780 [Pseudomonas hydrolytica]UZZ09098.1 hypothetical protein NDO41_17035 [Pseudomonas mendocina]